MFHIDERGFFTTSMYYEDRRMSTISGRFDRIEVQTREYLGKRVCGVCVTVFRTNGGRTSVFFNVEFPWVKCALRSVFIFRKRPVVSGDLVSFIVKKGSDGLPVLMVVSGNWVLFPCVNKLVD